MCISLEPCFLYPDHRKKKAAPTGLEWSPNTDWSLHAGPDHSFTDSGTGSRWTEVDEDGSELQAENQDGDWTEGRIVGAERLLRQHVSPWIGEDGWVNRSLTADRRGEGNVLRLSQQFNHVMLTDSITITNVCYILSVQGIKKKPTKTQLV